MGNAVVQSAETLTDQLSETDNNPAFHLAQRTGGSWKETKCEDQEAGQTALPGDVETSYSTQDVL